MFDKQNIYETGTNEIGNATRVSDNVIDHNAAGLDGTGAVAWNGRHFAGRPKKLVCVVTKAFTTITSVTITVETAVHDATVFNTAVTVLSFPAILLAALTLGAQFVYPIGTGTNARFRWSRLKFTIAGSAGVGKMVCGLVETAQENMVPD